MFADYRRNSSPSAIFTTPRSRDRRKNSSAAMFTTLRNHSHGLRLYPGIAPGWVYYFRPTIAAFAIIGTNP